MRNYTKEEIETAAKNATSISGVFKNLGLVGNGGSYGWMKKLLIDFNIDIQHFTSFEQLKNPKFDPKSSREKRKRASSPSLRKFMFLNGLECKCAICGLKDWQNQPIRLDVDHIDEDCLNNNIDNLQFLCPNCHRQKTIPSFCLLPFVRKEREKRGSKLIPNSCNFCGASASRKSKICRECYKAERRLNRGYKIDWPNPKVLQEMIWNKPMIVIGKELGVSDNAVRNFCKNNNIALADAAYWVNKRLGNHDKALEIRKGLEDRLVRSKGIEPLCTG